MTDLLLQTRQTKEEKGEISTVWVSADFSMSYGSERHNSLVLPSCISTLMWQLIVPFVGFTDKQPSKCCKMLRLVSSIRRWDFTWKDLDIWHHNTRMNTFMCTAQHRVQMLIKNDQFTFVQKYECVNEWLFHEFSSTQKIFTPQYPTFCFSTSG